ncbi:MAG: hypothetical protein Q9209_002876 [Squamulea sp. 1 TL-2023]
MVSSIHLLSASVTPLMLSSGKGHGPRRRYNDALPGSARSRVIKLTYQPNPLSTVVEIGCYTLTNASRTDENTTKDDLAQITDAPGPPTIQPGIPALQPNIPTTGVASLSIPPAHQTSSLRSLDPSIPSAKDPQSSNSASILPSPPASQLGTFSPVSTPVASTQRSTSTTTSIPFLSELMSQLFSKSSETRASSIYAPIPSSTASPSMLIYSFKVPPYSNGFDTSGIVETMTASSPAEDKDKPSPTVYSYNLPPYTPKIPTYVATSAGTAPLDMTAGAPGNPGGAAPTNRIFLQQGSVDPTKDAVTVDSSVIPVYSPACLGNAYGGGYVITPTLFASNTNATGIAKIPPVYGFSYKLEPTQSLGYVGAAIVVDTKAPTPTVHSAVSIMNTGSTASPAYDNSRTYAVSIGSSAPVIDTSPSSIDTSKTHPKDYIPTAVAGSQDTVVGGSPIFSFEKDSTQLPTTTPGLLPPNKDMSAVNPKDLLTTPHEGPLGTDAPVSTSEIVANGHASPLTSQVASRVKSIVTTISTTWCPSTAPDHLNIVSSILGGAPLGTAVLDTSSLPQAQLQRAALATGHLSSQINTTLLLPKDESELVQFQGKSSRPTASMMVVIAAVSITYLALGFV